MITTQVNKYSKFERAIQWGRPFYLEGKMRKLTEKQIEARRMPAGEVIARLSDHARGSMSDFLVFDPDGEARIDLAKAKRAHRLQLIRRLRLGENSVEVDFLYDAQEALIQLGRHHRLFVDRVQNEDWRARAIEDIKAGRVTYEALVNAFDESLAQELFQEAEKQVAVSKS